MQVIKPLAAAVGLTMALAPGAAAQSCVDSYDFTANGSITIGYDGSVIPVMCTGSYDATGGANAIAAQQDQVNLDWAGEGFLYAGSTDPAETYGSDPAGVFEGYQFDQGSTSGTLNFSALNGVFVLALKASNRYSLFRFDTGGMDWTSLSYNTAGVATNKKGKAKGLSHARIFTTGSTTTVPEPGTMALLLTGLGAVGILSTRRREGLTEDVTT